MVSDDRQTVLEAREQYFAMSGFNADTYTDNWVRLPILGFQLRLPNFSARKKAVPLHDIDHILTGYKTDWKGEGLISAYELGTGCGRYWAAWAINLQGILIGLIHSPAEALRAFARGRRSKGVYRFSSYEDLLSKQVTELRRDTTASAEVSISVSDVTLFAGIVLFSVVLHVGVPLLLISTLF